MRRRHVGPRRLLCATFIVVSLLFLAVPDRAQADELPPLPGSVLGGDVRVTGRGALTLAMGWPSTYVRYDFPTWERFGLALQGDFYYGMPVFGFAAGLGFGFSVPMRVRLWSRGPWDLALFLRPGMYLAFGDYWYAQYHSDCFRWDDGREAVMLGIHFEPGVRVGFEVTQSLNVVFGGTLGTHIVVIMPEGRDNAVEPFIPLTLFGGVELAIGRSVNFFGYLKVGPTFGSAVRCALCSGDRCVDWDRSFAAGFTGQFYTGFNFFFL